MRCAAADQPPLGDQAGVNSSTALANLSIGTGQCGYRKAAKSCVRTHTSALLRNDFPRCDSTYSIWGHTVASARNREGRVPLSDT